MSKQIYTIQSPDKVVFDEQINTLLKIGFEILDGSYKVINNENGVIYSSVVTLDEKIYCVEVNFDPNGQLGGIRELNNNGEFHGLWIILYNSKLIQRYNYKNGENHGEHIHYRDNGQILQKRIFKDGTLLSDSTWYDNGNKEKEVDYTGKNLSTYWYENGNRRSHGRLKKEIQSDGWSYDIRFGFWTHWYENGNIWKEGKWINGDKYGLINVEDGFWTYWYENGQKDYEVTFKDNEPKNY